jgi:hypothetical protein
MRSEEAVPSGRRRVRARVVLAALAILLCAGVAFPHAAGAATNSIATVAGSNSILGGFSGDGGLATAAELAYPDGVAATADGGYLFADSRNGVVRRVSPTGIISTVAGNGGSFGDSGPATSAQLRAPLDVAATADGGFLIADAGSARIRKVSASGIITTVAGNGTQAFAGDGGAATSASLWAPSGVAATADGGFLIADTGNSRVRKVSPDGTITTVAGNGVPGFSGDGGPATQAQLGLNSPYGVEATADGGFLIADDVNSRVRKVSPSGTITTVAGTGVRGYSGDGGPATAAALNTPTEVAATADGGFLIADWFDHRVRRVSPTGTITTLAGNGTPGFSGNGGAATAAQLDQPFGVAATASGGVLIGDSANNMVRLVDAGFVLDTTPPTVTAAPAPALVANTNVAGGRVPVRISWAARDTGSGVSSYQLQESVGGGAFTNVSLPTAATTQLTRQEIPGTSYTYQVRATDAAGNTSTFRLGRPFTVRAFQESDAAIAYSSGWTTTTQTGAFGGGVSTATAAGSTATFSLGGALAVAWVSTKDASSGGAHVLLDNATTSTVNLNSASTLPGRLVYAKSVSASASHTVRVTVDGTASHPKATVDAFVVIQ